MNRRLNFKQTEKSKIYFVSDTHWNHSPKWDVPLWKSRGYGSVEESNEHIINEINATVREDDILFHLGDHTLNCTEEQFEFFIGSLKCKSIYSLWGNHNSPSWGIYNREVNNFFKNLTGTDAGDTEYEVYPFRYKNIIFMGNYAEITVDGRYFVLSHYPIYVFNHMKDSAIHLTGHSHYNLELSQATNTQSKILDVGWDGQLKPWSVNEILEVMKTKGTLKVDHHKND